FERVEEVRQPSRDDEGSQQALGIDEQVLALRSQLGLDTAALRELVSLNDEPPADVREEALDITRELATRSIRAGEVDEAIAQIDGLLAVRNFPGDIGAEVVAPIIADALRPTVRVDEEATAAERAAAAEAVAPVQRTYPPGTPIVQVGEVVSTVQ